MLNPVSSAVHSQATAPATTTANAPQPKAQVASAPTDTVQITAAAKALQEALESPAQTAKEAAAGDLQAKHLLAKEAAEKANG